MNAVLIREDVEILNRVFVRALWLSFTDSSLFGSSGGSALEAIEDCNCWMKVVRSMQMRRMTG